MTVVAVVLGLAPALFPGSALGAATPPTISKTFGAGTVPENGKVGLFFTIQNNDVVTLTGVSFTDSLPSGMVVASPNEASNDCGGTITAVPGSSSIGFSGGTIAPPVPPDNTGGTCNIAVEVQVTANVGTTLNNTTDPVTSNESGPGSTSNTATITVTAPVAPPTISKSFGAAQVPVSGTTSLTFTVSNPNTSTQLVNTGFTDPLPAGLQVASPNGATGTCLSDGGVVTADPGSGSITLSTLNLSASASCSVSVDVTATTAGVKQNTTEPIAATYDDGSGNFAGITGNTASATLTVVGPPTVRKAFGAKSIPVGGSTALSFTVSNPNASAALTGVGVSDTLPAGLMVASPNGLTGSCGGGTITATPASDSVSLTGASLGASSSCTFAVKVTGTSEGHKVNTTGSTISNEGGSGTSATASLFVGLPPVLSSSFSPASIVTTSTASLTFTVRNPNRSVTLTGIGFSDLLPPGLVVRSLGGTCGGGTITASPGSRSISLARAELAAGATCTFTVRVRPTGPGVKRNTAGPVHSTETVDGAGSSASLMVRLPSNHFTVTQVRTHPNGDVDFRVTVPGPGTLNVLETAWKPGPAHAASVLRPGPGRFAFAQAHLVLKGPSRMRVTVRPGAEGKRVIAHHRLPVHINLWVTYTPTGGVERRVAFFGLLVAR